MNSSKKMAEQSPHIMIAAGEASGDQLGGELMQALKKAAPQARITGLGGEAMKAQGLTSLFPMRDIAVMGLAEILPRLPLLLRRIQEMVDYVLAQSPDVLVMIDSPEFAHRVARKVKKQRPDIKIVIYVAPTVWAWRQGRAQKMRQFADHVLAVLPFEPRVYRALDGPDCHYVGHSVVQRMGTKKQGAAFKKKLSISKQEKIIAILPGSRISEIKRLLPIYRQVFTQLADQLPDCRFMLPAVAHLKAVIEAETANWPIKIELIEGEADKLGLFHAAHAALIASGTVSLELAMVGLPMIVAYKMDPVMEYVVPRMSKIPSVVLPNLILDEPLVPEFILHRCRAELIAPAFLALINNQSGLRDFQLAGLKRAQEIMQPPEGSPSQSAARRILDIIA